MSKYLPPSASAAVRYCRLLQMLLMLTVISRPVQVSAACGGYTEGVSSGFRQTVTSPNYPSSYDRNDNCIWLFVGNNYTELQVNVTFMQLETYPNGTCKDYVLVTEGSATATQLGSLCSGGTPTRLVTLSRYLWIQFRSDHQNQDTGFVLTVTAASNSLANATDSPVTSCQLTEFSCPNKQCINSSYLCDNVNDCGCSDYGCDETKCWEFDLLNSIGFNWGAGIGIGFFIGLLLLIIFGLYEMPQHRRPECLKRRAAGDGGEASCLLACSQRCRRNKVDQRKPGDQFKSMMERMSAVRHPLRWDTESESSRPVSRRTSASGPGSQGGSRRSSYQLSVSAASYGNTLSPKDLPPRLPGGSATAGGGGGGGGGSGVGVAPSPKSAAAAAVTLAVPSATSQV